MEITLSSPTIAARSISTVKMVSTIPLNYEYGSIEATTNIEQRNSRLLPAYDSTKKGNSKSEAATVHIPSKMLLLPPPIVPESESRQSEPVIFTGGKCSSRIHVNRTECISAVTESVSSSEKDFHVVKIQISPNSKNCLIENEDNSETNSGSSSSSSSSGNTSSSITDNCKPAREDHQQIIVNGFSDDNTATVDEQQNSSSSSVVLQDPSSNHTGSVFSISSKTKSYLPTDLSAVQPVKTTSNVSIVSFISEQHQVVPNNSSAPIGDNGKGQCKIVETHSKINISQTLLNNQNSEDFALLEAKEVNRNFLGDEVRSATVTSSALAGTVSILDSTKATAIDTAATAAAAASSSALALPVQLAEAVIVDTSATITSNEMVQKPSGDLEVSNPTYLYYMMTSGQCSPSDTLDSGTCSDMENGSNNNSTGESVTPPPLPKKVGAKLKMHLKTETIVTEDQPNDRSAAAQQIRHNHKRASSFTDSEESECSLSCDSLNSSEFARSSISASSPPHPPLMPSPDTLAVAISLLPDSLLRDIRDRKFIPNKDAVVGESLATALKNGLKIKTVDQLPTDQQLRDRNKSCVLITQDQIDCKMARTFENDKFYKFHINEKDVCQLVESQAKIFQDDESFAGFKDITSATSTIRSSKGTVRGVKNRVRNGIATFLQMHQQTNVKNYKEKDSGKVVLYTTSMGIIRETYAKCANVKQILRTLLVKFEERDVFMSGEYQQEIKERMQMDDIQVPQLFVEGQHIGDAATVERLNESGELRQMLKPYKSITSSYTCQVCGGYRLLPCQSCNGSKKSVHRNHFTTEFVALKCMNCDEVGLVKCHNC